MAAVTRLESKEPRQVLILAGAPSSGREVFLAAVADRLTQRGHKTQLLPLSLDGYEPLGPGLQAFVEFRLGFEHGLSEAQVAQLRSLLERVAQDQMSASHGGWACGFALLLALGAPESVLKELLAVEKPSAELLLGQVLAYGAQQGLAIVHVAPESTLSDPTAAWLLIRSFEQPGVSVAFSCAAQLASEALTGGPRTGCTATRIELSRSVEQQDIEAAEARVRMEAWFEALGEDEPVLRKVLRWAAACGEVVPILPLLAAAEVSQADAERLIDRLDDDVCGQDGEPPLFEDLAYRHPGFPGLSVYRFRDRVLRATLRQHVDPAAQLEADRALLDFLGSRLGVGTRSVAQLFVNLTETVQFDLSAGPRQRLRLWVGPAEVGALETLLRADVKAGRLPADALFTTALRDHSLPVHQRLALLEASALNEPELPAERRTMLMSLRAELLIAMGGFADALQCAEQGLSLLATQTPEPQGVRGLLLFLQANCHRQLGQTEAALGSFKLAAEQAKKPRPDGSVDYHNIGVCLAEAGHCHAERQEWGPAIELLREGIAALRQSPMDPKLKQQQLEQLEKNLGICETNLQAGGAPAST